MTDPYSVLGLAPGADEESIKKAYRQKCKQYHPDLHPDDPVSEERFKEVQAAYSEIMRQRNGGPRVSYGYDTAGGGYGSAGGQQQYQNPFGFGGFGGFGFGPFGFGYGFNGAGRGYGADTSPELQATGNYIRSGYYREALNALDGMPSEQRSACWHYYAALANSGLGNNLRAVDEARAAVEMEPGNYQYQALLERLQNPARTYNAYRQERSQPGMMERYCLNLMLCNLLSMCCCRGHFFCC